MQEQDFSTGNENEPINKPVEKKAKSHRRDRIKSHKRTGRLHFADFLIRNVFAIIGILLLLGGFGILMRDKFSEIFTALFSTHKIHHEITTLPSVESIFNISSLGDYLLFIPGLLLIIISFFLKRKNTVNKILSFAGYGLIYFKIFSIISNNIFNVYQIIILIIFITIVAAFTVFDLSSVFILLFVIVLNFFALFILYIDAFAVLIFPCLAVINLIYGFISLRKKWQLGITVTNVLSILFFTFWVFRKMIIPDVPVQMPIAILWDTLIFLSVFVPIGLLVIKKNTHHNFIDIINIVLLSVFYYVTFLIILNKTNISDFSGLFSLLIGLLCLSCYFIFNKYPVTAFAFIFAIIASVFISAVLPIVMKYYTLLFFLAMFFIFVVWFAKIFNNKLYLWAAIIFSIIIIMNYSIIWIESYIDSFISAERGLMTAGIARSSFSGFIIALSYLTGNLLIEFNKNFYCDKKGYLVYGLKYKIFITALKIISFLILYPVINYYINYLLSSYPAFMILNVQIWYTFTLTYLISLIIYANIYKEKRLKPFLIVLSLIMTLIYPIIIQPDNAQIRNEILINGNIPTAYYFYHYINIALAVFVFIITFSHYYRKYKRDAFIMELYFFLSAVFAIFLITTEYNNIYILIKYKYINDIEQMIKYTSTIGFSLIWICSAFILIYISFRMQLKVLRTTALVIVFFTLIKIFVYDFDKISDNSKVTILIVIGGLLLILSVLYRRLKNGLFYKEFNYHSNRRKKLNSE